jgi:nitronate monooxygenase/enoyl-[acyl-carrier protein] reductase II
MIPTPLTRTLGIEHPIIQGPLGGPWGSSVGLAAAVSNAGALGSLPTALGTDKQVREDAARLRDLTDRPFAVNHTMRPFIPEVFQAIIDAAPPVVSFALGLEPELVERAHEAGSLFVQQVHTVEQAERAVEIGADVVIAQGNEAGGFGGAPGTLVLVPQVAAAVAPVPVAAAGGVGDGRGLAAALVLGAAGANVGTRFLASEEAEIDPAYKEAVLSARSEDTARATFVPLIVPPGSPGSFEVAPRVMLNPFVREWLGRDEEVARRREAMSAAVKAAAAEHRAHEMLPIMGEVAGMMTQVLPASEIVRGMVADAEAALRAGGALIAP